MKKKVFNEKEYICRIIIKLIAIISSVYGIIKSIDSILTFTYFTILSNIFIVVMLSILLYYDFKSLKKKEKQVISNNLYRFKFLSTISITLTFLAYMLLLAPTVEQGIMYAYFSNGASSFCVHLLAPVLTIIDFLLFDKDYKSTNKDIIISTFPPLLYTGFIIVLSSLGVRWSGTMQAPYNFLNFGAPTGWFGLDLSVQNEETLGIGVFYMIIIILIVYVGLSKLYLVIKDKRK